MRFRKETKEELAKMREGARAEAVPAMGAELEVGFRQYFPAGLDFPKRPSWNRWGIFWQLGCLQSHPVISLIHI